jgi:hypothetical protein
MDGFTCWAKAQKKENKKIGRQLTTTQRVNCTCLLTQNWASNNQSADGREGVIICVHACVAVLKYASVKRKRSDGVRTCREEKEKGKSATTLSTGPAGETNQERSRRFLCAVRGKGRDRSMKRKGPARSLCYTCSVTLPAPSSSCNFV